MADCESLTKLSTKNVEFQDVYYTVQERQNIIKVSGTREILCGVSGSFRNGQLSAIMGPSGAGKSSLLNAISGYRTSGVRGHINIYRKDSAYITQEDNHQTLLAVEELMNLACNLKLKCRDQHQEVITDILQHLFLNHRRKITANHLSGGERKRLSIALELVANPNILFLDEPTSGLDEVTAGQCIRLLSQLAQQGRTIVCTIHQPSATIFNHFDSIFVLAKGHCVYQGSPAAVLPFLRHIKLECPKYYSPSDYIIELCDSDEGKLIPMLSELIDNGKLIYAPEAGGVSELQPHLMTTYLEHDEGNDFQQAVRTIFIEQPTKHNQNGLHVFLSSGALSTDGSLIGGATAIYEHMKAFSKRIHSEQPEVSGLCQFRILLYMMMLRIVRARIPLVIQLCHHIVCGLFYGLIFLNLGNQGGRMFDHLKYCIGLIIMIVYTQMMVPILSFPSEVKIMKKETFNRWYSLTPYYLALTMSRLPLQFFLNMTFMSIAYWMTGLPNEWWRFGLFCCVGMMTSLIAEGMGLAIGATFCITNGTAVGPFMVAPFLGLAVYGFDFAARVPIFMNILMKFSYIRVSVVAMVLTVFGFDRPPLDCDDIYCHFGDPRVLLKFLDIDKASLLMQFFFLMLLLIFFRALVFIGLKRRCGT